MGAIVGGIYGAFNGFVVASEGKDVTWQGQLAGAGAGMFAGVFAGGATDSPALVSASSAMVADIMTQLVAAKGDFSKIQAPSILINGLAGLATGAAGAKMLQLGGVATSTGSKIAIQVGIQTAMSGPTIVAGTFGNIFNDPTFASPGPDLGTTAPVTVSTPSGSQIVLTTQDPNLVVTQPDPTQSQQIIPSDPQIAPIPDVSYLDDGGG